MLILAVLLLGTFSLFFFLVLLENAHTVVRNSQGDVNSKGYYATCVNTFCKYNCVLFLPEFLVSKETVVLHRWERSKQKLNFGFIGGNSTFIKSFDKTKFLLFFYNLESDSYTKNP